ncbi:hypothetical protein KR038_009943 [Drosophila bunnanda]|nr:hypothetical protein KR038_009943 [Drosophila bunnanda]
MLNGSPRNFWLASWPPGAHLLNFPQPTEPHNQRMVSVHFQSPPDRILNIRTRRLALNPDNGRASGQVEDDENNQILAMKFMRLCYLVATVYCVVTVIQMLVITQLLRPSIADLLPGFVCIIMSLMALSLLSILSQLRKILWMSIILSAMFVELLCVGLTLVLVQRTLLVVGLALLAAGILLVLAYVLGAWLPKTVLPGERAMLVLIIIFALISIFLITMHIFSKQLSYATAYFSLLLLILFPVSAYHAQLVHGRRLGLPPYEFVISATYIYLHFVLFFSASYYLLWLFAV